jgi:elongation factor Ts
MIDAKTVADLRNATGAGIVDCKNALTETNGDIAAAAELLRKKGIAKAAGKGDRATKEGLVHAYIHGDKVGALVEVQCETDFVARTEQFRNFVHEVAMQVAATSPLYVSRTEVPENLVAKEQELAMAEFAGSSKPADIIAKITQGKLDKWFGDICLLEQRYIKDEDKTIEELLKETIAKTGENMTIKRFARFALEGGAPAAA